MSTSPHLAIIPVQPLSQQLVTAVEAVKWMFSGSVGRPVNEVVKAVEEVEVAKSVVAVVGHAAVAGCVAVMGRAMGHRPSKRVW